MQWFILERFFYSKLNELISNRQTSSTSFREFYFKKKKGFKSIQWSVFSITIKKWSELFFYYDNKYSAMVQCKHFLE